MQPSVIMLSLTIAPFRIETGGRSSERVWMIQARSFRSTGGGVLEQVHLRLPVGLDGSDVDPVALERVREDAQPPRSTMRGMMSLPKSCEESRRLESSVRTCESIARPNT